MTENFDNTRELLKAIREGKIPSERSREYWSDNERNDLTRLYLVDGVGISQISLYLQRSESAIVQQLAAMGLLTPPGNERPKTASTAKCRCPKCKTLDCPYYREGCCSAGNV